MPLGVSIGVYLETNGVLVAGTSSITGKDGINYEPSLNKIYEGDYITKINGIDINSKSQYSWGSKGYRRIPARKQTRLYYFLDLFHKSPHILIRIEAVKQAIRNAVIPMNGNRNKPGMNLLPAFYGQQYIFPLGTAIEHG